MAMKPLAKDHPMVKHLSHIKQNRDYRFECQKVLIEGEKLIHDLAQHFSYHHLVVQEKVEIPKTIDETHVSIVTEEVMKKITQLPSPPAMVAEFDMPKPSLLTGMKWILVLDHVQDPGNVGTLLRSAYALNWEGCYLIDSVDPFHEKVLRAAQGATFKLPYCMGSRRDFLDFLKMSDLKAYRADLNGEKPSKINGGFLIVGNEGQGVHNDFKHLPAFTIPMREHIESLNASVAGSILMYAIR